MSPIVAGDLKTYGVASLPEADGVTSGGAIALLSRPDLTQFSAAAIPEVVSDNAGDTMNCTILGRLATGAINTETKALTGTTPVTFVSVERILKVTLASAAAGQVTVKEGVSGTIRVTLIIGDTISYALFIASASAAAQEIRYEKLFKKNTHGSLDLNDAELKLTADPDSKMMAAEATTKDDSGTVPDRNTDTKPATSGTFVDDNVVIVVPSSPLAFGEAIGLWLEQSLDAADSAYRSTFTTQLGGTTV